MGILDALTQEDLDAIKSYQAAMGPTAEDRASAKKQAIIMAGLGMLGARKGYLPQDLSRAAQGGLLSYNQDLKDIGAQRGQNLMQATQIMAQARQAQSLKSNASIQEQINKLLLGAQGSGQQAPGYSPAMEQSFGLPPDTRASINSTMSDPTGAAGSLQLPPNPPMAAPQQGPQQGGFKGMRDQLGQIALLQGALKGDITSAFNAIYKQPTALRQNAGYIDEYGNVHAGGQAPPGYTYNPQTKKLEQIAGAQDAANTVESNQLAVKGAYTAPHPRIGPNQTEVVPEGGQTQQLYPGGTLPYGAKSPQSIAPTGGPGSINLNLQNARPEDIPGMLADIKASQGKPPALPQTPIGNQVKLSPAQQSESSSRGEVMGSEYKGIINAADTAIAQQGRTSEMRKLVPIISSGATAPIRQQLGAYALEVPGVGDSIANMFVPNAKNAIPAMQVFNKMSSQMVIEQSKQLGTREAASVIQMVAQANPNVQWTKPAMETVLDYIDGSNNWAVARQQAAKAWAESHGNSLTGFVEDWNKNHPLTDFIPPMDHIRSAFQTGKVPEAPAAEKAAAPSGAPKVGDVIKGHVYRGGDPSKRTSWAPVQ